MDASFPSRYFWDSNVDAIDLNQSAGYIVDRILELGDIDAFGWLLKKYGDQLIIDRIKKSRQISLKSAHFFMLYFGLKPDNIVCLQPEFQKTHRMLWQR